VIVILNALMGLPPWWSACSYTASIRAGPLGSLGLLFTPGAMIVAQTSSSCDHRLARAPALEDAWREYEEQLRARAEGRRGADAAVGRALLARHAVLAGLGGEREVGAVMIVAATSTA